MPEPAPLCFGMSEWFDSVDELVHAECAQLCARCPVIDRCRKDAEELLAKGMPIQGTWAGERYGLKPPRRRARCGTNSGPHFHRKNNEEVCDECLEHRRVYDRERRRRHRMATR